MSRPQLLVVVSRRDDIAGLPDALVSTADAYITGAGRATDAHTSVINLCRSIGYGSDGYYVSLLADARGQYVLPRLERSAGLADSYTLFRALQEAGVPTLDAAEMAVRQRDAGYERLIEDALGPLPLVQDDGAFRAPYADELAEFVVCAGVSADARFMRLAAQVFAVWPSPLLRLRVVRDDGCWKVAGLAHASPVELDEAQQRLLREVLTAEPSRLDDGTKRRDTVRASLAVLVDSADQYSPSTPQTIERLERVAARLNVHVARIGLSELRRLPEYDALFIRTLTGVTLPSFPFALRAAALDMPVIDDAESIMRCSNKVFIAELLDREGVPVPRTRIVTRHTRWTQLRELGLPFVIKLPDGSFSEEVHRIDSHAAFTAHARALLQRSPLLIAQEWVPTAFDWRITVLDGRVLFAARYHMARGHWQIRTQENGEERYGRVEAVARSAVPRAVTELALRVAALIGHGMYGVDLKDTRRGPVVIEVNDNPNLDAGYEDVADGDVIYEEIVHYFLRRIEEADRDAAVATPVAATAEEAAPQRTAKRRRTDAYGLFEVAGLELEYPTVSADLDVVALVEPAFRAIAGRGTSDIRLDTVAFSNEIADHVFEVKTPVPVATLREAEDAIAGGVRRFAEVLQQEWDARLLPTGMHPWFDPLQGRLWARSGKRVYATYARIFDIRTHGWMNVHATHLNLPFGDERETIAMHAAAAMLLPYLPAIAASSPMHDGRLQPYADARLAWIVQHQARIPQTCGRIVPEPVDSFAAYRRDILRPMYAALDAFPQSAPLRQEFLNARGAVLRFARRALELRVLDTQECVRMDVAIAAFSRAALRQLTRDVLDGRATMPPADTLVADFEACIRHGTAAAVQAPHLRVADDAPSVGVHTVFASLLERVRPAVDVDDAGYLDLVAGVIRHGSLAQRIRLRLEPHAGTPETLRAAARQVYGELADCLLRNEPWTGRWQAAEEPLVQRAMQPVYVAPVRTTAAISPRAAASMR